MPVELDPKKASKEDIAKGLELLQRQEIRKEKIARGEIKGGLKWSEMSEEQKEKARQAARKRNVRIKLMCQKAVEAGITVSEDEIEAEMAA